MRRLLALPALSALVVSCVEQNPTPPPGPGSTTVFAVDAVWWSHAQDNDSDGYCSVRQLNFDADADDEGSYYLHADVYYRPVSGSGWRWYDTCGVFAMTGNVPDTQTVLVGAPGTQLPHGLYDFRIVVYDEHGSQVAERNDTNSAFLADVAFETAAEDAPVLPTTFAVRDAWWGPAPPELDGDGHVPSGQLCFNVDASDAQTHVLYAILWQAVSSATTWTPYDTTPSFTITGSDTGDHRCATVGAPNVELSHNTYGFLIEIYDQQGALVASLGPTGDADLNNRRFETDAEDAAQPPVTIYDVWWGDTLDYDADGYSSYRKLYFDADAHDGMAHKVYAVIDYSPSTGGSWYTYLIEGRQTTDTFTIAGTSSSDGYFVAVGLPNPELPHNTYNFRVRVYDYYTDTLVAIDDEATDVDLNNQRFETDAEDAAQPPVTIYDVWWSDTLDYDADGYSSYRKLYFDVDAHDGMAHKVYAVIDYSPSTGGSWYTYYVDGQPYTDTFTIADLSELDARWVAIGYPNPELPHNTYDFRVRVYDHYTDALVAIDDEATDVDLNNQRFETDAEDPTEVYIFETYWYDTLDYDGDGYFSYGKLCADVDAMDGLSTYSVYLRLYYRPSGSSTYTLYLETSAYQITGDQSDDAIWVSVGQPNTGLPLGAYDFLVEAYRTDTPTLQDWLGPADEPEDLQQWFVEPASQDLP